MGILDKLLGRAKDVGSGAKDLAEKGVDEAKDLAGDAKEKVEEGVDKLRGEDDDQA